MKKILFLLLFILLSAGLGFAQDWELEPAFGSHELDMLFDPDPQVFDITSGGSVDVSLSRYTRNLPGAAGYIAEAPDLDLYYNTDGALPLTIKVDGHGEDTILVVNDPTGQWFYNDDTDGIDPAITFQNPVEGLYSIWVGSYWEDDFIDVSLILTELSY